MNSMFDKLSFIDALRCFSDDSTPVPISVFLCENGTFTVAIDYPYGFVFLCNTLGFMMIFQTSEALHRFFCLSPVGLDISLIVES